MASLWINRYRSGLLEDIMKRFVSSSVLSAGLLVFIACGGGAAAKPTPPCYGHADSDAGPADSDACPPDSDRNASSANVGRNPTSTRIN